MYSLSCLYCRRLAVRRHQLPWASGHRRSMSWRRALRRWPARPCFAARRRRRERAAGRGQGQAAADGTRTDGQGREKRRACHRRCAPHPRSGTRRPPAVGTPMTPAAPAIEAARTSDSHPGHRRNDPAHAHYGVSDDAFVATTRLKQPPYDRSAANRWRR